MCVPPNLVASVSLSPLVSVCLGFDLFAFTSYLGDCAPCVRPDTCHVCHSNAVLTPFNLQTRAQNWRGLEHLLKAFAERFEQRDAKRPGTGLGIGGSLSAANRKSALLLPNWFDDAAEYRLKKALVRLTWTYVRMNTARKAPTLFPWSPILHSFLASPLEHSKHMVSRTCFPNGISVPFSPFAPVVTRMQTLHKPHTLHKSTPILHMSSFADLITLDAFVILVV